MTRRLPPATARRLRHRRQPPPHRQPFQPQAHPFAPLRRTPPMQFNPAISAVLSGRLFEPVAGPRALRVGGLRIDRGRVARPARDWPGRIRNHVVGECRSSFRRQPDRCADTREHRIGRGSVRIWRPDLAAGFVPKFGRFFSGIGYQNEQHQHAWDFYDAPLAYQAFLGGQYATDGVQLKWLAPTDQFLEFGAEIGNGDSFPGSERNRNGIGAASVFVHAGGDVGASHSWRAGLSYVDARAARPRDDASSTPPTTLRKRASPARAGLPSRISSGNTPRTAMRSRRNFKLQGEYFWRREHGDLTVRPPTARSDSRRARRIHPRKTAVIVQGVWQFMPMWRVGARYDRLDRRTSRLRRQRSAARGAGFPSATLHIHGRLVAVRIQPAAAADTPTTTSGPT